MVTVVEQALGKVHRADTELLRLLFQGEDELMGGAPILEGHGKALLFELRHHVIGVQCGIFSDPDHPLTTEHAGINISAQQNADIAHVRRQPTD